MLEDSSPSLAKAMESAPSSAIDGSYKDKVQKIKGGSNEVCNNKKEFKKNSPTVSITNSTQENNQVPTFEKNSEKNGTILLEKETLEKIPSESKLENNTLEKQNNQNQTKKKVKRFSKNKIIGKKKLRNKSSNGPKRKSFRMSKNKKKKISKNENNINIYRYDEREPKSIYESLYGKGEEEEDNNYNIDYNEIEVNEPDEDNDSQNNIYIDYQGPFNNQNNEIDNNNEIFNEEFLNFNYNHEQNGDAFLEEEDHSLIIKIPNNTIIPPYDSTND